MANTTTNRTRVAGSGFTIFTYGGNPIAFCQQVSYTSPQPIGNGFTAIQPMDEPYPIEIITGAAAGPGSLTLNMFELFGSGGTVSKIWDRLGGGSGTINNPFGPAGPNGTGNVSTGLDFTNGSNPFYGAVDIVDVFITQASLNPTQMDVAKYIRPLPRPGAATAEAYSEEYVGCKITNIVDGEQIEVGTLEVLKQITITFRYVKRNGRPSGAYQLRNAAL